MRAFNTQVGVRVDIAEWTVELSGGYGLQRDGYDAVNLVHRLRLSRAVSSSNPASAINLFGDGAVNDPALIDSLRGSLTVRTRFRNRTAALRADGPLFALPAGDVKLAIGAEYRRDQLKYVQTIDATADTPLVVGIPGLPDKRIVRAIYGELAIPVFDAGDSFPGTLNLSAAGRYEDYSDVGDTANPKFGARWEPFPGLAFRGSYDRSFRAPFFDELVGGANSRVQTLRLNDPASPTGQTAVMRLEPASWSRSQADGCLRRRPPLQSTGLRTPRRREQHSQRYDRPRVHALRVALRIQGDQERRLLHLRPSQFKEPIRRLHRSHLVLGRGQGRQNYEPSNRGDEPVDRRPVCQCRAQRRTSSGCK